MNIEGFITLLAWFMGVPLSVLCMTSIWAAFAEDTHKWVSPMITNFFYAAICWAWILSR